MHYLYPTLDNARRDAPPCHLVTLVEFLVLVVFFLGGKEARRNTGRI